MKIGSDAVYREWEIKKEIELKQEENFYWQSNLEQIREDEVSKRPFLNDHQYSSWQREKIMPRDERPSLVFRVALATISAIAILIALQTTLTIHGILYDMNVDPGGNTHISVNIVFVLFVFFVAFANIMYNRKR